MPLPKGEGSFGWQPALTPRPLSRRTGEGSFGWQPAANGSVFYAVCHGPRRIRGDGRYDSFCKLSNRACQVNFRDRRADADDGGLPTGGVHGGRSVIFRRVSAVAICAILAFSMISTAGLGQTMAATERLPIDSSEGATPPVAEATDGPSADAGCCEAEMRASCGCPRWTASADFITLDRLGGYRYTLVEIVDHSVPYKELKDTFGPEVLNVADLQQGFSYGPRLDLIHHGDNDADLELVYFQLGDWNAEQCIGPTPNDWLVMRAPGFLQTQFDRPDNFDTQTMAWDYASRFLQCRGERGAGIPGRP